MLQRMENQGFIYDVGSPHRTLDMQWSREKLPPLKLSTYEHEKTAADVYVACKASGLEKWEGIIGRKKQKVIEDRYGLWCGKDIYFEIDMCTMGEKKLAEKIARYVKRPGWFHVLFVVCSTLTGQAKFDAETKQAQRITELMPTTFGTKYLVTIHSWFATEPLGECIVSANRADNFQPITAIP